MDGPDGDGVGRLLRDVKIRPVRGAEERGRWDAPMRERHCLPFRGLFGRSLRQVAVRGEAWLALLGRQAGAFKVGVRDAWIGWTRERQFSRLHLVANDARFAVPEAGRVPNLASRALGPSLRRLTRDMRDAHGHPVLLAETFVDPSRFAGTCCRASNWVPLGRTRGFSREPGGSARWREHGRPKEAFVHGMEKDAPSALCRGELPGDWRADSGALPPPAAELRSLHAFLADMPDFRKARGRRCGLALPRDDHDRRPWASNWTLSVWPGSTRRRSGNLNYAWTAKGSSRLSSAVGSNCWGSSSISSLGSRPKSGRSGSAGFREEPRASTRRTHGRTEGHVP